MSSKGGPNIITFVVPVRPVPKARARVIQTRSGRHIAVTPKTTKDFESAVAAYATAAGVRLIPKGHTVEIGVLVCKSELCIGVKPSGANRPRGIRGDLDNILKSVLDALNGVAWEDDSQVVSVAALFSDWE